MSIEVFPAPSTSAGPDGQVFSITEAYKTYKIAETFLAGGYTVTTSPSTAQVSIVFMNGSTFLTSGDTISGSGSYNIGSDANTLYIEETSGSTDTVVTITYVAESVSSSTVSGTLDTITTSSTYNQTGLIYPVLVGGGGSGGNCGSGGPGGGGGGSGGITGMILYTNTGTSVVIGNGGVASTSKNNGGIGGSTTFGNTLTAYGGGGGGENSPRGSGGNFAGGVGIIGGFGGAGAGGTAPNDNVTGPTEVAPKHASVIIGTTGGGGGGGGNGNGATGKGSGIGTGGTGGRINVVPNAATGYGAGGGGGAANTGSQPQYTGASGSQGVVYVLRGF